MKEATHWTICWWQFIKYSHLHFRWMIKIEAQFGRKRSYIWHDDLKYQISSSVFNSNWVPILEPVLVKQSLWYHSFVLQGITCKQNRMSLNLRGISAGINRTLPLKKRYIWLHLIIYFKSNLKLCKVSLCTKLYSKKARRKMHRNK